MPFDGVFLRSMVAELRKEIVACRIGRIQQYSSAELGLRLSSRSTDHTLVASIRPESCGIFLVSNTDFIKQTVGTLANPTPFCMLLRKYIESGTIVEVTQRGFDRILDISITRRNETGDLKHYVLTFEIMGKHSNIILIDEDRTILDAMKRVGQNISRVRQVYPGSRYVDPPSLNKIEPPLDLATFESYSEFWQQALWEKRCAHQIKSTGLAGYLVETIAGIGSHVANHICVSANHAPDTRLDSLDLNERKKVSRAIAAFFLPVTKSEYKPVVFLQNGTAVEFYCLPLNCFPKYTMVEAISSNGCLVEVMRVRAEQRAFQARLSPLKKAVRDRINVLERRLQAEHEALRESARAEEYLLYGELLTAYKSIPRGSSEAPVPNYYDPAYSMIIIPLDPALSAIQNAQKYFAKYHKAKRIKQHADERIEEATSELEYLHTVTAFLEIAESLEGLDEIESELEKQDYIQPMRKMHYRRKHGSHNSLNESLQPLHITLPTGWNIWIGRNNRQNDHLLRHIAKPEDYWLHAKQLPGSHVILRAPENAHDPTVEEISSTLETAAGLAAYFSKGRHYAKVPVDWTRAKWVRKPKGAKPGYVIYDNQSTLLVSPKHHSDSS